MEAVTRPHRRIYRPIRSAAINAATVPEEIRELRSSSHDFYFHYDESLSRVRLHLNVTIQSTIIP